MKIRYKLTDVNMRTFNDCRWVVGEWKTASGVGGLCGPGWLHCYDDPLLAVLHNPMHANIENFILWQAEVGGVEKRDGWLKSGWTEMRLIEVMPVPDVTLNNKIAYGIYCAMVVCKYESFRLWAENWLSGADRSVDSARSEAARSEAAAAAWAEAAAAEAEAAAAWAEAWAAAEARSAAAWAAARSAELNLLHFAKMAMRIL